MTRLDKDIGLPYRT